MGRTVLAVQQRTEVGVVTGEAVVLDLEPASIGSRSVALLIDLLVVMSVLVATSFVLGLLDAVVGISQTLVVTVVVIVFTLGLVGYPAVCETVFVGRSAGKAALGLRVRTVDGGPVRFRHAAIRAMLGLVDFLVPPVGGTAVVSALCSPRSQRLGDLVAGTVVVRERVPITDVGAVWFPSPIGWERYVAVVDVRALTTRQHLVVRSFLLRAAGLTSDARAALGFDLATRVADHLGAPAPAGMLPETYLSCVCAARQQRAS